MNLVIIDYGSGNLRSVQNAFNKNILDNNLKIDIKITNDPDTIKKADFIVLPGVGSFPDCKRGLVQIDGAKLKVSPKMILKNYQMIKKINPAKNLVIGFGITTKTIAKLKNTDGLVVGSQLCKEITRSLKLGQNPVTNLHRMVLNLKRKII